MSTGHEMESGSSREPAPHPPVVLKPTEIAAARPQVEARSGPTPEVVLRAIAAASPQPWFPSTFAVSAGIPRESLDEPLSELRLAGLTRISDWVRGLGQGYSLTPTGEACAKDAAVLAKLGAGPPLLPPPELETLNAATSTVTIPRSVPEESRPARPDRALFDLRPPTVTPALLIANLAWFVIGVLMASQAGVSISEFLSRKSNTNMLLRMGAVDPQTLIQGQWWRLLTNAFVHIGLMHLLINMFALGMTGSFAEVLWGRWRLAIIYVLSALGGSCLAMGLQPVTENGTSVLLAGASGAIWGMMTSLLAWLLLHRDKLPQAQAADWSRRMGLMFMLNVGVSLLPGISWAGHLGGGIAGFIAAGLVNALKTGDRLRRSLALVLLLLFPFACVGGLSVAMRTSESWAQFRKVETSQTDYPQRLKELLKAIEPQSVAPLGNSVTIFAIAGRQTKDPARRDEYIAQIDKLLVDTTALLVALDTPPKRSPKLDQAYVQARSFAEAQQAYLTQLRHLLDAPGRPDAAAYTKLNELRTAVDARAMPLFVIAP